MNEGTSILQELVPIALAFLNACQLALLVILDRRVKDQRHTIGRLVNDRNRNIQGSDENNP
jgi:hypothetical protein